ncbi:ATPase synthesis protein 25 mitochondrial [Orbilia oligospora]|nr:ATPase synthesis protein 25 mitochondrial [Orbilia oligospora]KAF3259500.1 ATPase synthesis protein 25 mitochondrial [Orbilia oligospora]KAF3263985.1 ATPase synthesis protein 25 mitochondrial [Orbilia oligospora]KAF3287806.1 ATPase synthesis protein 25 mitochondrial [Orbilia oligospora]
MPLSASRQLISPPKWCPSCSLALFRAFASVCGTTLPNTPARRIGRTGYRQLSNLSSKNGGRFHRNIRINGTAYSGFVITQQQQQQQRSFSGSKKELGNDEDYDGEFDPTPEEIKKTDEEWEKSPLRDILRGIREDVEDPLLQKKVELLEAETMANMIRNTAFKEGEEHSEEVFEGQGGEEVKRDILERLDRLKKSAGVKKETELGESDKEPELASAHKTMDTVEPTAEDVTVSGITDSETHVDISTNIPQEDLEGLNEAVEEDLEFIEEDIENSLEGIEGIEESEIRAEEEDEEDIEYRSSEPAAPSPASEGTPWYLQSPLQPAPRRFVSPLIEQMPDLPPNPPKNLDTLLNYLIKELSLSKIKIMDLRDLDPTPALGANTVMLITTARSERHMTIASDKCARYMRSILDGSEIYADGLIGRGEIKLRERRERRKGKRRTAEDEEAMRVGWVCVNSGQGIVVQIMTGWRREQLNLEGLWSRKIHTSMKRKLKDRLLAEGLSEDEVRETVARELPERLDMAPEYDAQEDAIEARKVEAKLIVSEVLPPLEDPSKVGLEEFNDVVKVVEIHSKSKKKQEGKRYIDIPAVKQKKLTWREKQKRLEAVSFSTKRAFSTSARQYGTLVEATPTVDLRSILSPTYSEELTTEELVRQGRYEQVLKAYPRPRTDAQATLVLLAHLNHLLLTPRGIATTTLLSSDPKEIYSTPFFKSFMLSFPKRPAPTHNHIRTLVHIAAHNISPLLYPIKKYTRMPSEILQGGNQVPLITYHTILRALATSPALRGDHPKSLSFWTNRTSDTLSVMTLYILRKMDVSGIDVGHDPEVFESLWLAMAPQDTLEYSTTLGNARLRSEPIKHDQPFSRAVDHRLDLYKQFHRRWYDPFQFIPVECSYFRGPAVEEEVLSRLLHKSMQYPPENPRGRYQTLPSYLVTMFVTLARARLWGVLKNLWRWLPGKGVRRPKSLYALYLELLAREAEVRITIEGLRFLLSDYEKEYAGREDVSDGVAEGLVACVEFIETRVPGTGQEFGNWRRRSEAFLSGGKVTPEKGNYTYVI